MSLCNKVLIVEDEALIALDLEMTLEDAGFEVMGPANSLGEALEIVSSQMPRGAILDIDLNNLPVWPLARRLRDAGTHIVFVSADLRRDELDNEFENEPKLGKPVTEKDLLNALKSGIAE